MHVPACTPDNVNVVLYHDNCWDGFGAAWAVWFTRRDAATYIARKHTPAHKAADDILEQLVGKHVLVVDYCFPLDVTHKIMRVAASFLVLDHHVTAAADMEPLPPHNKVFTTSKSGATLAYGFMHGDAAEVPPFLRYIEDGDLWLKRLPGTDAFRIALSTLPYDFSAWEALIVHGDLGVASMLSRGAPLLEFRDQCVASSVKAAKPCVIAGFPDVRAKVVNTSHWVSEVGSAIVSAPEEDAPQVAVMWSATCSTDGMRMVVSLRSRTGGVDVAAIARAFGGGGHAAAAGFSWPPAECCAPSSLTFPFASVSASASATAPMCEPALPVETCLV
jgi:oligoribonuclease NrnB/cAMP/cGMP phosphodiesterase (DHH superfamily)